LSALPIFCQVFPFVVRSSHLLSGLPIYCMVFPFVVRSSRLLSGVPICCQVFPFIAWSSYLLSVSPLATYSKIIQSMRKGMKRNKKSLVNTETRKQIFCSRVKLVLTQE
jgi:hypothetical protein